MVHGHAKHAQTKQLHLTSVTSSSKPVIIPVGSRNLDCAGKLMSHTMRCMCSMTVLVN